MNRSCFSGAIAPAFGGIETPYTCGCGGGMATDTAGSSLLILVALVIGGAALAYFNKGGNNAS